MKRNMASNKKGDSTIIAVVLLTVIVVGLGALLFTFFRGQVMGTLEKTGQQSEQIMCSSDLSLTAIADSTTGKKAICSGTDCTVTLEAGPTTDVNGLMITAIGLNVTTTTSTAKISKATTIRITENVGTTNVTNLKIIPKMTKAGKETICPDAAVNIVAADIG